MPPAHAAAGKNIKNVAVNSPGGVVIKFKPSPLQATSQVLIIKLFMQPMRLFQEALDLYITLST